jgi:hypothetical protein
MRQIALTLALTTLVLASACSSSKPDATIPLVFRPDRQAHADYRPLRPSPSLRLSLAPVADERADKKAIGENTEVEKKPARPVYGSGPSPAEFVGSILSRELVGAGLTPVPESAQSNRVLAVRLTHFYTTESNRYNTDVRATAEVRDGSGHVLWTGQSAGQSSRFGRSLSAENYNQGFSDATLQMIGGLLNDEDFRKAVMAE